MPLKSLRLHTTSIPYRLFSMVLHPQGLAGGRVCGVG